MSFQALSCIYFIGFIFLISSLAKAWSPTLALPMLERLGIESLILRKRLVLCLIFIEAVLAAALLLTTGLNWALWASMTLLATMILALGLLIRRGFDEPCACYGQWLHLNPIQALKLDLIYLLILGYASLELSRFQINPSKIYPTIVIAFGLAMVGLGKLRASKLMNYFE